MQQNQVGSKQTTKQTDELKPMYDGVKTTAELNQKLLETIKAVDTQPTGIKPRKLKSGKILPGGTVVSESAAATKKGLDFFTNKGLKAKFEKIGEQYSVPPALIAAIASRESGFGLFLKSEGNKYYGWGDYGQRDKEKFKQYHGFSIMQIDKNTAALPDVAKEMNADYGKTTLDPYAEKFVEAGVKTFLLKFEAVKQKFPKLSFEGQIATAVSRYNGGSGLAYPKSDVGTTGNDYANDTLVRARWFANNWDKLK